MVKETPPPEPTIKDELRALKVDRILQVAAKLFIERGFVGTTMEAIADQMSMTKPFIYQFFPNKHALLAAICDRELRDSLSMLNAPLTDDGPPEQRLVNFVRIATLRNIENRGLWSLMSVEEKHLPKEMLSDIRALEMQFHHRSRGEVRGFRGRPPRAGFQGRHGHDAVGQTLVQGNGRHFPPGRG